MPLNDLSAGIRRGLAGGLIGGLLAGLFAVLVGQPAMEAAIALEEQHAADAAGAPPHADGDAEPTDHDHGELVARGTQRLLLPVGTTLVGLAYGGLFGIALAVLLRRAPTIDVWRANLSLAAAAWGVLVLAPLLTHPPNPPGVGDAATVGARTSGYLLTIAVAVGIALAAVALAAWLRSRAVDRVPRHLVVAGAVLVAGGVAVSLLAADPSATDLPAELLWRFRSSAVGTQTVMWMGIAAGSGALWARPVPDREIRPVPV